VSLLSPFIAVESVFTVLSLVSNAGQTVYGGDLRVSGIGDTSAFACQTLNQLCLQGTNFCSIARESLIWNWTLSVSREFSRIFNYMRHFTLVLSFSLHLPPGSYYGRPRERLVKQTYSVYVDLAGRGRRKWHLSAFVFCIPALAGNSCSPCSCLFYSRDYRQSLHRG
jgi:hypothetical protein